MAQIIRSSFDRFQKFDPGSILDDLACDREVDMGESGPAPVESPGHLIVAFDFGTTFSSVAYARVSEGIPRESLGIANVVCISRFPDDRPPPGVTFGWESREDVPTELWYSLPSTQLPRQPQKIHQNAQNADSDLLNEDPSWSDASSEFSCSYPEELETLENEQINSRDDHGASAPLFWGFGVQKQLKNMDIPKDGTRRLTRFKLMLDENNLETKDVRADLSVILKNLKKSKTIKQDTDVVGDYLEQLFKHTKEELRKLKEYNESTFIELVLCVPAVWPSKACRVMQAAMNTAARRSEFGNLVDGSLDNLFIISEPEAAAACVLAEEYNDIYVGKPQLECEHVLLLRF